MSQVVGDTIEEHFNDIYIDMSLAFLFLFNSFIVL